MSTAPAADKTRTLTSYHVLRLPMKPEPNVSANDLGIKEVGKGITAANANAAIKIVAEKAGEGTYVAIPERSWQPVTVKVEQTTTIRLS